MLGFSMMLLPIAISLFFGLVAAVSIASCHASLALALRHYRAIRAELTDLDRAEAARGEQARLPLRQPQAAFVRALAA